MGLRPPERVLDAVLVVPPGRAAAALPAPPVEAPAITLLRAAARQGARFGSLTVLVPAAEFHTAAAALGPGPSLAGYDGPAGLRAELAALLQDAPEARGALIATADVVVSGPPLGDLLDDPRFGTGVLVAPAAAGGSLALAGGDVAGPGEEAAALGVARLDPAARAAAARDLPGLPAAPADPVLAVVAALTGAGVPVRAVPLGPYAWARPAGPDELAAARAAVAAIPEVATRLRRVARSNDGFWSTFVLRRGSPRLTGVALRLGLTPNAVTLGSLALGLAAAGLVASGGRPEAVAAAVLLQACLLLDCVDGELARYRRRFSRFGAWLDATTDRVKEFAVIAALAFAAGRAGAGREVWLLAGAAVAVQTFRHLLDLGWSLQRAAAAPVPPPAGAAGPWRDAEPVLAAEAPVRTPAGVWLRRIGHVPIGERFLLLSLGLALWTPAGTLAALVGAGGLATAYMLAAFAVRSGSLAGSAPAPRLLALVDVTPPLASAVRRLRAPRAAALLPAAAAAGELACVLAAGAFAGAPAAGLALAAVVAVAGYQRGYRLREQGDGRPRWFGAEARLAAVAVAVALPAPGAALGVLAGALGAAVLAESAADWLPARTPRARLRPATVGGAA